MSIPLWQRLGAHADETGTTFAVWAPHARAVSVIGDFCDWDARAHPLDPGEDGVWRGRVDGVGEGDLYQFSITSRDGDVVVKSDPLARRTQRQPQRSSVVDVSHHVWTDAAWLRERALRQPHREPMSVYEVHLGSWRRGLTYLELVDQLVPHVADLGFTHVELMPVMEHPFTGSWGYQVSSYFAPTSRFGSPDDFRALIDAFHAAGVAVILDWVPGQFPDDAWALDRFDGEPLYDDDAAGGHVHWHTRSFDLSRPQVREFLVQDALFWIEEMHADGLRVDAVASMLHLDYGRGPGEWIPNADGGSVNQASVELLREINSTCYGRNPGIAMIAEDSSAWAGATVAVHLGGLGFGFTWGLGWMHDTLDYLGQDPLWRRHHHGAMVAPARGRLAANQVLTLSHDEVVHGKGSLLSRMPGDDAGRLASLRCLLAWQWAHPGKQLLFMGQELAQPEEWSVRSSVPWQLADEPGHLGVMQLVSDLNRVYADEPALWEQDHEPGGFEWIVEHDPDRDVLAFARRGGDRELVCIANFAGIDHPGHPLALPRAGSWAVVVDTDAAAYGGGGGRPTRFVAEPSPHADQSASAVIDLPALSVVWLRPEGDR